MHTGNPGARTESRQALQQMRAVSVLLPELASRLELMRLPLKRAFCGAQIWDRNCSVGVRLPLLRSRAHAGSSAQAQAGRSEH